LGYSKLSQNAAGALYNKLCQKSAVNAVQQ